ncbi:MAG: PQQ-dependent sugar dehydrogenase [Pseudomonadota bacterium]
MTSTTPSSAPLRSQVYDRWAALPRPVRKLLKWGVALGVLGLVFLIGFQVAYREVGPYQTLVKVDRKLTAPFASAAIEPLQSQDFPSTLLTLQADISQVETGLGARGSTRLYQHGGGLASFGDKVLLLAYTGEIFSATSGQDIAKTAIKAPDNGRDAYLAMADDPDSGYNFHRGYLRYNDLLFVQSGPSRGLYASYSEFHADEACTTNTLAHLPIRPQVTDVSDVSATSSNWTVIYRTSPCLPLKDKHLAVEGQMASGQLAFEAPATMYMTSGDYHLDGMRAEGEPISQDPAAEYGKVLKIDVETGAGEIVSMGHRNMQGISFGPDGEIYVTEHGPRGGDEINRIVAGANYGWPVASLGTAYSGTPLPTAQALGGHDGFEPPVMAWVPSIAPTGMVRLDGFHEAWAGDFLIGSLNDRALHRLRMRAGHVLYTERIPLGTRIRLVHQHTDGRVVLWTDNQELIFLSAKDLSSAAAQIPDFVAGLDAPTRVKSEFETALSRCMECHSLNAGDHARAPSLASIFENPIGETPYEGYSNALKSTSGRWDAATLAAYLTDPQAVAPGTYMPAADTDDPRVVNALVEYLEHLDNQF